MIIGSQQTEHRRFLCSDLRGQRAGGSDGCLYDANEDCKEATFQNRSLTQKHNSLNIQNFDESNPVFHKFDTLLLLFA